MKTIGIGPDETELPVPSAPCDECLQNKKGLKLIRHKASGSIAFYCEECQLGAYCHTAIKKWQICQPVGKAEFSEVVNGALLANGFVPPRDVN